MTRLYNKYLRRFLRETRAAATVEFVIALPILLAMLAFAVQYGNALKVRNNLDVASRDAARYLARAPLDSSGNDVPQVFKTNAKNIVAKRVETTKSSISSFTPTSNATSATVDVTINVPFPLLRWLGMFDTADAALSMSASETWTRTGDGIKTSSTQGGG